jgi:nucleoside-diphosphate-sugar epimerase
MRSTNIAIAGAGAVGRAIIDDLKSHPQYKVFILTRDARKPLSLPSRPPCHSTLITQASVPKRLIPPQQASSTDLPAHTVDYNSPDTLATFFRTHSIDTVISTIAVYNDICSDAQLNLIRASVSSGTVKRFVPSDFGIKYTASQIPLFPLVSLKLAAVELLKTTGLEYTLFHCGYFLDFYGHPKISGLGDGFPLVVDGEKNEAAIPGSGEDKCVFTHTRDIGRFVVRALEMEEWPEDLYMSGDRLSWNEVVKMAEVVKGTYPSAGGHLRSC